MSDAVNLSSFELCELLEGLTLDECAQQCIMRFAGQRCSAFSYGFRGRVSQLCSIISDPNGCWRLVPDGEFHSYSIRDAGSNSSSPAVWPVLMPITTTVTSTTRTTITITSTEGFLDCSEIRPWANLVLQTMGGMAFWKEPYILKVARLLVS
eukprot:g5208.t1